MAFRVVFTVACVTALAVAPIAIEPAVGQLIVTRSDIEAESRVSWLQMKRNTPRVQSPAVNRYVQCIARSLMAHIPDEYQKLDWEIIVFDVDQFNAFAQMDGKVGVFSGVFEVADTPAKLAAVLGHELSHVTEDHVIERLGRARTTGILGALGGAVTGVESRGVAEVIFGLPYKRDQETEADIVGMSYMAKAGYDPRATIDIWRTMVERGKESGRRPPEWLSTHPDPEFRMSDIARSLAPALVEYNNALDAGVRPQCVAP